MATSALFSHLRRRSFSLSSLSYLSSTYSQSIKSRYLICPTSHLPPPPTPCCRYHCLSPNLSSLVAFNNFFYPHCYSTTPSGSDSEYGHLGLDIDSGIESEVSSQGCGGGGSEIVDGIISGTGVESILPVRALSSSLDWYHDVTGWPWWILIASSTLALRMTLFPLLILQLTKLRRIGEFFPKLPPPLPPPLSGRSYINQFSLFRKERRAIGCPSFLWFLAYVSVQVPCFLLWMTTIRRMSLDSHPGFDCDAMATSVLCIALQVLSVLNGGTLWFLNLTEFPNGVSAPIFPLLIAGFHYVNVQISFRGTSVGKVDDLFGTLAKYYKIYLDLLTLPLLFIGFSIPQGSLVYWVTNSSLTMIQQLFLKHPAVRETLRLPSNNASAAAASSGGLDAAGATSLDAPTKQRKVSVQTLSPKELLALAVKYLSDGHEDRAIPLLRLALDKDPEYVRALVTMGITLVQKGLPTEGDEYLERAISKLHLVGNVTEVEDLDLLIVASQWAGVACIRQNKKAEGIVHLERIATLEEPEDPKSKAHYFDGLVLLASALYDEGRKHEAAKHLRRAVAYNPAHNELLEQCLKDEDDFVSDLVTSRRGDY